MAVFLAAFLLVPSDVVLRELLEVFAGEPDLHGLFQSFVLAPVLLEHPVNHHEGADSIGAGAVDEHGVIGWVFYEPNKFIRLLRARGAGDHRNIEIPHFVLFDERALTKEVNALIGHAQAQDRVKAAGGNFSICSGGRLAARAETIVQAKHARDIVGEGLLNSIQARTVVG